MTNQTDIKSYARAIDARSYIEARDDLAGLKYDITTQTVDGKRRAVPEFYVTTLEEAEIVEQHGFVCYTVPAGADAHPPISKEPKAKVMAEKAMLASLTIKGWSGRASDKEVAAKTAMEYQADDAWVKFTKQLVTGDALKAIKKAEAAARATHKKLTLPWNENGQRILPAAAYHDYVRDMGTHRDAHTKAVDQLLADYEDHIEEGRRHLGGMFKDEDYPSSADLQAKYLFDTQLEALDTTGDFRVAMSDDEMSRLQEQITQRTETRLAAAMTDVYQRLHDVVSHMADRLKAYKPKETEGGKIENPFRDATLNNVRDIVDLLPKLNVANDPALDALAAEVRQNLLEADADTLRSDGDKRAEVAAKADQIANAMAGMM